MGEVLSGAPLGNRHVPPACQGFAGQEQVPGALPPVLAVLTLGASGRRRDGRPGVRKSNWVDVSPKQTTGLSGL